MKRPIGRPTLYHPKKTIEVSEKYLASCVDEERVIGEGRAATVLRDVHIPTAEGLALALDVSRDTLYDWAQKYPAFADILGKMNKEQAKRLIDNGLAGKYNATIAKLVLGKHGYKEQVGLSGEQEGEGIKVEVDVTDTIGKIYRTNRSD